MLVLLVVRIMRVVLVELVVIIILVVLVVLIVRSNTIACATDPDPQVYYYDPPPRTKNEDRDLR